MSNIYGYVRVSTKEQKEDRQLIAMEENGVSKNKIYIDKQSGKDFERPQYKRMLKRLREGEDTENNTWDSKADCILSMLEKYEQNN